MQRKPSLLSAILLVSASFYATSSVAQEERDLFDYSLKELLTLQVLEVTAQRQSEKLQDVPIAITKITPEKLDSFSTTKSNDLQFLVPGMTITQSLSSSASFLRGVGSAYSAAGGESPIAYYIDDVYRSSTSGTVFNLNNIESIEVLKGPQGTLFGRNATGGVVNVRTKEPSDVKEGEISVEIGNYNYASASAYVTGPLSDSINGNLSVHISDDDGYGKNTITGEDAYDHKTQAYTGKLNTLFGETSIKASANWSENINMDGIALNYHPGSVNSFTNTALYAGDFNTTGNVNNENTITQYGASIRIESPLDWAVFKSISAFQSTEINLIQDGDRTPLPIIERRIGSLAQAFTQELQLLSPSDSHTNWILGAFIMDEQSEYKFPETRLIRQGRERSTQAEQTTESYALFGQATMPLSENTCLSFGLRQTYDRREATNKDIFVSNEGILLDETYATTFDSWSEPTWRLAVHHHFTTEIMGYLSYNRGFKAGLFNMSPFNPLPVNPEILDAVEIGFKTVLLEERLRLNTAAYHYNYDNLQVQGNVEVDDATFNILFNAASAQITGLDIDAELIVNENLFLSAGIAYIDGEYDQIRGVPFSTPNPEGGNMRSYRDLNGLSLFRTPKYSGNLSATYDIPSKHGDFMVTASCSYNSEYYFDAAHITKQESMLYANASLTWTAPSNEWSLSLWGRNLTNELRIANANSIPPGDLFSPTAPRTYGVRATRAF